MGAGVGRFLIVEDEPLVAKALVHGIVRRGLGQCVVAGTEDEARALLKHGPSFAALIIDIILHDRAAGLDVLAEGRRSDVHALTPTVVLSASIQREHINRATELDAKYLVKPVEPDVLASFLEDAISPERMIALVVRSLPLTPAMADVVRRSALGEPRDAIAQARGTTVKTIENQAAMAAKQTGRESFHALVEDVLREAARAR